MVSDCKSPFLDDMGKRWLSTGAGCLTQLRDINVLLYHLRAPSIDLRIISRISRRHVSLLRCISKISGPLVMTMLFIISQMISIDHEM